MKKSISYVALTAMLAFGAVTVYAEHHAGSEAEKHAMKADVNNDGKVSFEEFKNARIKKMEQRFKHRDTNGDGFIDESERAAAKEKFKAHKKACKLKKDKDKHAH